MTLFEEAKLTEEEIMRASQRGLHPHGSWMWNEEDQCYAVANDVADAATAKALRVVSEKLTATEQEIDEVRATYLILCEEAETAKAKLRELEQAAGDVLAEIPPCWCDQAFTSRDRVDPACIFHHIGAAEVGRLRRALAQEVAQEVADA